MCILQYDSKRSSQIVLLDLININSVITDLTILNIIETVDQIGNRRLTGAGRTDECNPVRSLVSVSLPSTSFALTRVT